MGWKAGDRRRRHKSWCCEPRFAAGKLNPSVELPRGIICPNVERKNKFKRSEWAKPATMEAHTGAAAGGAQWRQVAGRRGRNRGDAPDEPGRTKQAGGSLEPTLTRTEHLT